MVIRQTMWITVARWITDPSALMPPHFMAAITALRAFSVLHSCMKRISEAGMPYASVWKETPCSRCFGTERMWWMPCRILTADGCGIVPLPGKACTSSHHLSWRRTVADTGWRFYCGKGRMYGRWCGRESGTDLSPFGKRNTRLQLAVDNSRPCVAWFGFPENMVAESGIPVVPSSGEIRKDTLILVRLTLKLPNFHYLCTHERWSKTYHIPSWPINGIESSICRRWH